MPANEVNKIGVSQGSFVKAEDNSVECKDTIELRPSRKWRNDLDFHEDLHIETLSSQMLLLTFEAKAREALEICLSPIQKFTYKSAIVTLGGTGNTETSIAYRKQAAGPHRTFGRVVREDKWVSYWVCYDKTTGRISVGIGELPGQECIGSMVLPVNNKKHLSKTDAESSLVDESDNADKTDISNDKEGTTPVDNTIDTGNPEYTSYAAVGFRNASVADRQAPSPLFLRSIRLAPVEQLTEEPSLEPKIVILGEDEIESLPTTDQHTIRLLQDHRETIAKAKARAIKFNVPYVEPSLSASLNWSDARRLKANPTSQNAFATGIDGTSEDEVAKRNQRKERFGIETLPMMAEVECLPVDQAWDKLELCGMQRIDPPNELWIHKISENEPFAMTPATVVKEKIHIFSMDWSAFKQIRTSDIIKHFADFGPTYVEWLGDLSCNILFEDEHSATRALEAMSQELPVGTKEPDLGAMGWRFGKTFLRKASDDKHGRKGTTARMLMRIACSNDVLQERPSSWPKPPAGFSKNKILGPDSDLPRKKRKPKREAPSTEDLLNGALSSSRGGFTAEALEAERAAKRAKSN